MRVLSWASPPWPWSFETGEPRDCLCMLETRERERERIKEEERLLSEV
jgi:hypothetical protein